MAVGAMVFTGPVMATGYMSGNDRLGRRRRRGYADGGAAQVAERAGLVISSPVNATLIGGW